MNSTSRALNYRSILSFFTLGLAVSACGGSVPTPVAPTSEAELIPTVTELASPQPSSSSEPVPIHSQITVDDVTLSVSEVLFPADEVVSQGSDLNPTPALSTRYMFVTVTAICDSQTTGACTLGSLRLVDSTGEVHFPEIGLTGIPCEAPIGEFPSGETWDICLVFLAPEGDPGLTLKHESFFGEETFFALQ